MSHISTKKPTEQGFSFQLQGTHRHARAGKMTTAHGTALTPMFMPVGTLATVKSLDTQDIAAITPQVILANTYHLYLRPGHELIAELGGVHEFMGYHGPMLTDSGGFQVFSLGAQMQQKSVGSGGMRPMELSEEGVWFSSHVDGSRHWFPPEHSIQVQQALGSDIMMVFDECLPDASPYDLAAESIERTHRWAERCVTVWEQENHLSRQGHEQALFGIVQGAMHKDLRQRSLAYVKSLPFSGIALGGETVGYNMAGTVELMEWLRSELPEEKPRYAMGLGRDPQNVIDAVMAGYDMFDCVAPTRLARNGTLYYGELDTSGEVWRWDSPYNKGRLQIGNAQFRRDNSVIQPGCDCFTCQAGYSRAYLNHLFKTQELTYYRLASLHNVRVMVRLTEQLRSRILE